MGIVTTTEFEGCQIRIVEIDDQSRWYVTADVCRCLNIAINSRTGKPNVTVATRDVSDQDKQKYRIETPENPKNPWIDMMIVSEQGLNKILDEVAESRAMPFKSRYFQASASHTVSSSLPQSQTGN